MAQGQVNVVQPHPGDFRVYNYTNIAASTGSSITVLKLGGGVLHGFTVSAAGAAATSQLLIIDSTASASNTLFTISGTSTATQLLGVDLAFTTALSVQSQAVTSTTPTITVLWK